MTSSFYDVIKLLKFCSFSALILLLNFNGVLKTGKYVEVKPLSFQKLKKEFKNLFCSSSKVILMTGTFCLFQRQVSYL